MFSCELQYMNTPVLANQQKLIFFSSVQTLDAVERNYQERWLIETDGERGGKERGGEREKESKRVCTVNIT